MAYVIVKWTIAVFRTADRPAARNFNNLYVNHSEMLSLTIFLSAQCHPCSLAPSPALSFGPIRNGFYRFSIIRHLCAHTDRYTVPDLLGRYCAAIPKYLRCHERAANTVPAAKNQAEETPSSRITVAITITLQLLG